MSHPDRLPDLFLDRSLGRHKVPGALRQAGVRLTTLAERYGVPADQDAADVDWLAEAGRRSEAVLMKDERVRHNPAEWEVVTRNAVRCFCLSRKDLTASEMAQQFIDNLEGMATYCETSGPFMVLLSKRGLSRLPLE